MNERLDLHITATTGREHAPFLRKNLLAAHALLRTRLCELSLALVGDVRMSDLHERFLRVSGPTDVLTFELDHDARGWVTAGEVVICVPEAVRQSRRHRMAVRNELLLYALHGMLHLSGFDDTTKPGYRKMHAMEDKVLTQLGIGAVFERATAPGARFSCGASFSLPDRRLKPAPQRSLGRTGTHRQGGKR